MAEGARGKGAAAEAPEGESEGGGRRYKRGAAVGGEGEGTTATAWRGKQAPPNSMRMELSVPCASRKTYLIL